MRDLGEQLAEERIYRKHNLDVPTKMNDLMKKNENIQKYNNI